MKIRRSILKDAVIVKTRTGESSYGDTLNDPVTVFCQIDETRRLVRSDSGQETVSEATLLLHPQSKWVALTGGTHGVADPMDLFTAESEVNLNGRVTRVLTAKQLKLRSYVHAVQVTCA